MDKSESSHSRQSAFRIMILKGLFLYALFPLLCLWLLAKPIGSAVRRSDPAALWILLAALVTVGLNWLVCVLVRRRRPSLLVFACGVFYLFLVVVIECEALRDTNGVVSTLAVIGGCLTLLFLFLFSFWLASRHSKFAHSAAVCLWVIIGLVFFFMLYQVIRDFESEHVSPDTWIMIVILAALIPAAFIRRIKSSRRRAELRRRATGLAAGRIMQVIGETHLDRDGDLVTDYHALIQYAVDDVPYETRADIYKLTMRRFGKKALVGQEIPVHYNPADPGDAFVNRIDRHFFDPGSSERTEA